MEFLSISGRIRFGYVGRYPNSSLMRDFDNDGLWDILVTGSDNSTTYALYLNDGDKTFTRMDGILGSTGLYSTTET